MRNIVYIASCIRFKDTQSNRTFELLFILTTSPFVFSYRTKHVFAIHQGSWFYDVCDKTGDSKADASEMTPFIANA